MIVQNMTSQNGNKVPNQFIVKLPENVTIFQSYKTVIAQNRKSIGIFSNDYKVFKAIFKH